MTPDELARACAAVMAAADLAGREAGNPDGELIAEMRGRSRTTAEKILS